MAAVRLPPLDLCSCRATSSSLRCRAMASRSFFDMNLGCGEGWGGNRAGFRVCNGSSLQWQQSAVSSWGAVGCDMCDRYGNMCDRYGNMCDKYGNMCDKYGKCLFYEVLGRDWCDQQCSG